MPMLFLIILCLFVHWGTIVVVAVVVYIIIIIITIVMIIIINIIGHDIAYLTIW